MERKRVIPVVAVTILLVAGLTLFLWGNRRQEPEGDPFRVAAIMQTEENIFWRRVWSGLRDQALAMDIEVSEYPFSSSGEFTRYLEICFYSGVDAVIIGMPDSTVLQACQERLEEMRRERVRIIAVDMDIPAPYRDIYIGLDNYALGGVMADTVAESYTPGNQITILIYDDLSVVNTHRLNGCRDRLTELGFSGKVDILVLPDDSIEQLLALQEYIEEMDAPLQLVAIGPKRTIEVANIISRNGLEDAVQIVGLGESEEAVAYVERGVVDTLMMQDNYGMGAAAVSLLGRLMDGADVSPEYMMETIIVTRENCGAVLADLRAIDKAV